MEWTMSMKALPFWMEASSMYPVVSFLGQMSFLLGDTAKAYPAISCIPFSERSSEYGRLVSHWITSGAPMS